MQQPPNNQPNWQQSQYPGQQPSGPNWPPQQSGQLPPWQQPQQPQYTQYPYQQQPPYQQPQMPPQQPPRRPNFWTRKVGCLPIWVLILFIALFACAGINAAAKSGSNTTTDTTATTATTQATQADQPTQPIPTQEPPTATSAPQLQSVHDWHGKGTQKTEVFSMQGTWHVQWFCLGNSPAPSDNFSDYLTINLYNAGTGKILKTWQHNCTTDRFEEVVRYSGDFRLEGIVTQQTIEYHIAVLQ